MGVIASRAIKKFLQRPRRDFRPWKDYDSKRLDRMMEKHLPIRPPVWSILRVEQKVCFLLGALYHSFGFFMDTGMGKTFLTMALLQYFKKLNHPKRQRFLVLVPAKTNKSEWIREVKKHAPHLDILKLAGSSVQKWEQLIDNPDADIVVETYGGMVRMVSKLKERGKKKKLRVVWNPALMNKFAGLFDGLICDESIKVMNRDALIGRVCHQIRKRTEYCFLLNGTPFGRDPADIWGQVFLIDQGYSLGETLGLFRAAFYNEKQDHFGRVQYTFDKKKMRLLHDFIADCTISYEADEGTLPKLVPLLKKISLPTDAVDYAERAKRQIMASRGNYLESKNAFMRMRQISSGWLGYKDDETGEKASFNFKPNVKLEFLLDYLDTINPKYKFIVFHEFNYSGALISKALTGEGYKHTWIYGKTKDPDAALNSFANDPGTRGLILSNSLGSGLNLQMARYGIYFEAPVSPIVRYQTRRRFERQGSDHSTVFMVDLVVGGTYDETILRFHEEGKDLFDAIIRGRFKKRGGLIIPA